MIIAIGLSIPFTIRVLMVSSGLVFKELHKDLISFALGVETFSFCFFGVGRLLRLFFVIANSMFEA